MRKVVIFGVKDYAHQAHYEIRPYGFLGENVMRHTCLTSPRGGHSESGVA